MDTAGSSGASSSSSDDDDDYDSGGPGGGIRWVIQIEGGTLLHQQPQQPQAAAARDANANADAARQLLATLLATGGGDGGYEANLLLAELLGRVDRGIVDAEQRERVAPPVSDSDDEGICPICQEAAQAPAVRTAACGHLFCRGCLYTWLDHSTRCPVCMRDLEEDE